MGWFFVNIVLPVAVPLLFLLGAKLVDLDEPQASRAKLIRAVQDGQLGWVAIVFAAVCTYDLFAQIQDKSVSPPAWAELVLFISCVFLGISGFLATLGTLYPVDNTKAKPVNCREWCSRYRMFLGTAAATVICAALLSLVHYTLPAPCQKTENVVPCE